MGNFIVRRVIQTLMVIVALSYFCFYLMTLMPGDPVEIMISSNPKMTSDDVVRLRALYGIDQPVYARYATWINGILHGDLGYSRTYRIPVSEIMGPKLVNTFILSMTSLIFALLIAIPLGVLTALKQNSKFDYFANLFAFAGVSAPSFWLGMMFILILSVKFNVLPASGTTSISGDLEFWPSILDRAKYLILPTLTLGYLQVGVFLRFVRSSMIEALRNDYVRTAKAKGLSVPVVVIKHAFRNALLPLITILGLSLSSSFSGATITETVFAYQGVGKLVYDSIIGNDFNVAMVSFVISVTMVLLMSLIADICYGFADPRITYN